MVKVTKDMLIGDVVAKHPETAFVFMQYGLHCVGCHAATWDTIEAGAKGHGMPEDMIDAMVEDANLFIEEYEKKQQTAASE